MIKDQMPTEVKKAFEKFNVLDILQTSNGNLFIKVDPTHAIPLGAFEKLGEVMHEAELKAGLRYVPFEIGREWYIKVGKIKFKKKFLSYYKDSELVP